MLPPPLVAQAPKPEVSAVGCSQASWSCGRQPVIVTILGRKAADEVHELGLEMRNCVIRWSAINVIDIPELDPIKPLGEALAQQGPVLGCFHGHDVMRGLQVADR